MNNEIQTLQESEVPRMVLIIYSLFWTFSTFLMGLLNKCNSTKLNLFSHKWKQIN